MQVRQKAAAILNAFLARKDSGPLGRGFSIMTGSDWLFLASIVWIASLLFAMVWVLFGM
jgi:hypothetical protein